MVDGVKGVDRTVLIRTSMGASRLSVKKRQILSQSLAVQQSILSAARARAAVVGPTRATTRHSERGMDRKGKRPDGFKSRRLDWSR